MWVDIVPLPLFRKNSMYILKLSVYVTAKGADLWRKKWCVKWTPFQCSIINLWCVEVNVTQTEIDCQMHDFIWHNFIAVTISRTFTESLFFYCSCNYIIHITLYSPVVRWKRNQSFWPDQGTAGLSKSTAMHIRTRGSLYPEANQGKGIAEQCREDKRGNWRKSCR